MSPPARPLVHHMSTSPNLMNIHDLKGSGVDTITGDGSDSESTSDSETELDLLEYLNRIDYSYRAIKFRIPNDVDHKSDVVKQYEKRVAFDTINIQYENDGDEMFDDDDDDDDYEYRRSLAVDNKIRPSSGSFDHLFDESRGRSRSKVSPTNSPLHSPSVSPVRSGVSPLRSTVSPIRNNIDMARFVHCQPSYPTRPIITHKGCTFTKLHKDFEDLYLNKFYNAEHNWLKPVLSSRVILVYISGRKHTWVALDWILNRFIEHGDSVIIVSAIDSALLEDNRRRRRRYSNYRDSSSPEVNRFKSKKLQTKPEYVKIIAKNIMNYAMEVINPNIIAKVSIELAVGDSKQVLKEMYKLYEPNLVATGSKPRTRSSAPLRSWTSSRLTDRLVKNFPLPVIVTPAVNMIRFEKELRKDINNKYKFNADDPNEDGCCPPLIKKTVSGDNQSISSISSEESYSSFEEITETYEKSKRNLHNKLNESLSTHDYSAEFFTEAIKLISQSSLEFCEELRSIDPDFRGKGAKLAGAITGSSKWGVIPYKTKSLLDPVEDPKPKSQPSVPKISFKELKRNLQEKKLQDEAAAKKAAEGGESNPKPFTPPSINIVSPQTSEDSLSPGPPKQTLKFVGLENKSKTNKSIDVKSMKKIQKSLSNDDSQSNTRPKLEPLKSHPDLTINYGLSSHKTKSKDDEKTHKKKKSKFWKLFR